MFRIFSAIGRLLRTFGFKTSGKIDEVNRNVAKDPSVVKAKYDEVIRNTANDITKYIDAVGGLKTQREMTFRQLKQETENVVKLEAQKAGAIKTAQKIAAQYGNSEEAIKQNQKDWLEYNKCKNFHRDFNTTANEKKKRIDDLTVRVKEADDTITTHMTQLISLRREFDKLKMEQSEAVARLISATQQRAINDKLSNLSSGNNHANDLNEMREMIAEAEAGAKVSGEIAGTDTAASIAQFEAAAAEAIANDEFANLVGIKAIPVPFAALPDKSASVLDTSGAFDPSLTKVEVNR